MQITFTIPDGKVQRAINAIEGLYPIPRDDDDNPLFTANQWAKEKIRRSIVDIVFRYEQREAQREAKELIERDDTLVS